VLDRTKMGRFNPTSDQIVQTVPYQFDLTGTYDAGGLPATGTHGHLHGSPVYWEGPQGGTLFVYPETGALQAFRVDAAAASNPINPTAVGSNPTFLASHPGGIVTVSSHGAIPGTGIVWASLAKNPTDAWHMLVPGYLYAFSAEDVSKLLWSSEQNASDALGLLAKFCPPTVANGRLYIGTAIDVATNIAYLRVYGLH
jgi:hypothetical protein